MWEALDTDSSFTLSVNTSFMMQLETVQSMVDAMLYLKQYLFSALVLSCNELYVERYAHLYAYLLRS